MVGVKMLDKDCQKARVRMLELDVGDADACPASQL